LLFTAVNPAMPAGGLWGESKSDILRGLSATPEHVARFALIEPADGAEACLDAARQFMADNGLDYPVVLKPDMGLRGRDVAVVGSDDEFLAYIEQASQPTIVQEHVGGHEFGIFYIRYPNEDRGRIFSVTEKRPAFVVGDGKRTLEELILDDDRAVCIAHIYFEQNGDRLSSIPAAGEQVQLGEIGAHARGFIFRDGNWVVTPALEMAIDRVSRRYEGFYFGRYDIRTPCVEDLLRGRNFKAIELNGVSSEATEVYDPKHNVLETYRIFFRQWRHAFAIAAQNAGNGTAPATLGDVVRLATRLNSPPPRG
jgi:hypothetical protein